MSGSAGRNSGVDGRVSDPLEAMGGSALASIVAVTASWFAAVLFVTAVTCSISWVLTLVPAWCRPIFGSTAVATPRSASEPPSWSWAASTSIVGLGVTKPNWPGWSAETPYGPSQTTGSP